MTGGPGLDAAWAHLEPHLDRRPWLIVSDFDGTLAPLDLDPWAAAIVPAARRALRRLAGLPGVTVALLSGRTSRDLASRVRVGGALYLGDHGVERGWLDRGASPAHLRAAVQTELDGFVAGAERLADGVAAAVPERWLVVERKGPTVTFHYRAAPDVAAAAGRVRAAVDAHDPAGAFVRWTGRRALELRPPGAATKAGAMVGLLRELRPGLAIALGDDTSDAEAFMALRAGVAERREKGEVRAAISLAVRHPAEVLPDVEAAADGVLADPAEAARLLAALARRGTRPRS